MLLAPAERADVIVDFSRLPRGTTVTLRNDASVPYPGGGGGPDIPEIMQFHVSLPLSSTEASAHPEQMAIPAVPRLTSPVKLREIVLKEDEDPITGNPIHVRLDQRFFFEPVEDMVKVGSIEVWQYINLTIDAHPMHIHLVKFQVLDRQPLDVARYTTDYLNWVAGGRQPATKPVLSKYFSGAPTLPSSDELGAWKDTVKTFPGLITRVIARFDVPGPVLGDPTTDTRLPAEYVEHCHIIEHEDNDMMRPYRVVS
jgi:spore coat protein A